MVMSLALLVYSVAQRRLRKELERQKATLPDQLGKATATPTLKWVFQMLDGINKVTYRIHDKEHMLIEGATDLKRKILHFFGDNVCRIYNFSCL